MKTEKITSVLVMATLSFILGCKSSDHEVERKAAPIAIDGKLPAPAGSTGDLSYVVNEQGYAIVQLVEKQKVTWTASKAGDQFKIEFLHGTVPCSGETDTIQSKPDPSDSTKPQLANCIIKPGYSTLNYQIEIKSKVSVDWATDCRGCNLSIIVPGTVPGQPAAPGGPPPSGAAAPHAAISSNKPPSPRSSSNPGIAFYCDAGTTKFTYKPKEFIGIGPGETPTMRTWFADGINANWKVEFDNGSSPCTEGSRLTSTPVPGADNFRCTIPKGAKPGKFTYKLTVTGPACSPQSIPGTIETTMKEAPALE